MIKSFNKGNYEKYFDKNNEFKNRHTWSRLLSCAIEPNKEYFVEYVVHEKRNHNIHYYYNDGKNMCSCRCYTTLFFYTKHLFFEDLVQETIISLGQTDESCNYFNPEKFILDKMLIDCFLSVYEKTDYSSLINHEENGFVFMPGKPGGFEHCFMFKPEKLSKFEKELYLQKIKE